MGLESGFSEALTFVDNGYTREEAYKQLKRLGKAGIAYSLGVMLGLMGTGRNEKTGRANGSFFYGLSPDQIWFMSTTVMPGTPLARLRDNGSYLETSKYERVKEIRAFLENIKLAGETYFNSVHRTNTFRLEGYLPRDREILLKSCDEVLRNYNEESYQKLFDRSSVSSL